MTKETHFPRTSPPLLMEPGPTQIDSRVIRSLSRPPVHHLSDEFLAYAEEVCTQLARLFGVSGEVVILPASGRGGIEAVLGSLDLTQRKALIVSNGTFGRMMAATAESLGIETVHLAYAAAERIPIDHVAHALGQHDVGLVAMVHSESSTGMLNDLTRVGQLTHQAEALFLVDAISSLAGAPVNVDAQGIDFCVAAPQKAIGAFTGLALVAIGAAGISALEDRRNHAKSAYFDLRRWWDLWVPPRRGGRLASGVPRFPYSMPTNLVYALGAACEIILQEETLPVRLARHARAARAFRAGAGALGIPLLCDEADASPTVTALTAPPTGTSERLIHALQVKHGITIAGGLDVLRDEILRVGHMAETARPGPLLHTLAAMAHEMPASTPVPALHDVFFSAWEADPIKLS